MARHGCACARVLDAVVGDVMEVTMDDKKTKEEAVSKDDNYEYFRTKAERTAQRVIVFHAVEEKLKGVDYRGQQWDLHRKKWDAIAAHSMEIATWAAYDWFLKTNGTPVDVDEANGD